jgi:hypothetical protein
MIHYECYPLFTLCLMIAHAIHLIAPVSPMFNDKIKKVIHHTRERGPTPSKHKVHHSPHNDYIAARFELTFGATNEYISVDGGKFRFQR